MIDSKPASLIYNAQLHPLRNAIVLYMEYLLHYQNDILHIKNNMKLNNSSQIIIISYNFKFNTICTVY
jgi:hypothetical protein